MHYLSLQQVPAAAAKKGLYREAPDEQAAFRLDLDDLGGEICVLDWAGVAGDPGSKPPLQLCKKELNLRHYSVWSQRRTRSPETKHSTERETKQTCAVLGAS
jgi:hypothetical protein